MKALLAIAFAIGVSAQAPAPDVPQWVRTAVEVSVKKGLKDPDSARFRWLPHQPGNSTYCGLVNAKNSYGGYIGFVPFIAVIPGEEIPNPTAVLIGMGTGDPGSIDSRVAAKMCADAGFDIAGRYVE